MIILVGPSASGKTAIALELTKTFGFKKFVTTTTREKKKNEVNHVDYHFVSLDEFLNNIKNNEFIEYVKYNDNYYGSEKKEVDRNKVIILEPQGLKHFLDEHNKTFVSFYITCDPLIREKRMIERGDEKKDIDKRLLNDIFVFDDSLRDIVDFTIDSSSLNVKALAKTIYFLYLSKINN